MTIIQENDDLEIEIEKKKAEYAGVEYEAECIGEESGEEAEQPFDAEKIRVDQQMLSIKYMLELMEQNLIELNPGYQRRRVWKDNKRKSLLIESLMLRIPIPAFYFYENEDGKYQVIDGQQRLTTIKENSALQVWNIWEVITIKRNLKIWIQNISRGFTGRRSLSIFLMPDHPKM